MSRVGWDRSSESMARRETILSMAVLALSIAILFAPMWLRGETFALGDVPDQFLPWRIFAAGEVSEGRIPLWNPYSFCGAPFLANMQSAVLHPIDRIVDFVFGPIRGVGLGMTIHLFLGGSFLFLLARSFGASPIPAGIAALGYTFGGFHAIHFLGGNLLTISSSILLPGHFWLVHSLRKRIEDGVKVGWLPLAGVLLAVLQVLSGHAQMTFYSALFVGLFTLANLFQMKSGRLLLPGLLIGIGAVASLLAAPQILPTLEYAGRSSRTDLLPFLPATEFSFGWEFLATLFLPELLGTRADLYTPLRADTYWGDWKNWSGVYLGLLPAVGFVLFFLLKSDTVDRKKTLQILGPVLVVGLVLALGRNTPLYSLVHHHLPLFGKFRAPSKFLPGFIVPFAVIAALGLGALLDRLGAIRMCHKRALAWGGIAILVGGMLLGYALRPDFLSTPIRKADVIQREGVRLVAMVLMALGVLLFHIRSRREKRTSFDLHLAAGALLLFVALDVGNYCRKYLVFAPYEQVRVFPSEWVRSELGSMGRLLASPEVPQVNDCVSGGILGAGGYDPFQVGAYVDHFRERGMFGEEQIPDAWSPHLGAAAELGVTHVLTTQALNSPILEPHKRNGPWALYRVKDPTPRVEFLPSDTISDATTERKGEAVSFGWDEGSLHVSGVAPSSGTLLIRNVYMPGWSAVDPTGRTTPVLEAPPFWMSLPIEPGDFDLRLIYRPDSWRSGVRLFWAGLVLALVWGAFQARPGRSRAPGATL